jgi:hypothetical protein
MTNFKISKLVDYMKYRVKLENANWEIADSELENFFVQKGTRKFFGVLLDDLGNILRDEKYPDFYQSYCESKN